MLLQTEKAKIDRDLEAARAAAAEAGVVVEARQLATAREECLAQRTLLVRPGSSWAEFHGHMIAGIGVYIPENHLRNRLHPSPKVRSPRISHSHS